MGWYRELTADQRQAFLAAYLGWALDGFDFFIISFIVADIQHSFSVDKAAAGGLATITLLFRVVGGIGAGAAADGWGRKWPLLISIVWYAMCSFVSGFSSSYRMLFACRALFGVGMGGVWSSGVPLALEHLPAHVRGKASGLLQGGFSAGVILSAFVYQFGYPIMSRLTSEPWRALFWIGVAPAALALWIRSNVKESPVWLARRRQSAEPVGSGVSLIRLFTPELFPATAQATLVIAAFQVAYQAMTFWYPSFLASIGRQPLPFILALNAGGLAGAIAWGRLSETRIGRRGAFTIAMGIGVAALPLYLFQTSGALLWSGALVTGFFAAGSLGVAPGYLAERFPTAVRAAGAAFAYHVGAGIAAFTPYLVGALQDRGLTLPRVMGSCIVVAGVLMVVFVWMGPETRGRSFDES